MTLLDTNIFVRHVIPDDPAKASRCAKLLDSIATGRQSAVVTPLAIAEVAWVLLGSYQLDKPHVILALRQILNTTHLEIVDRGILLRCIDFYEAHDIDFIDAYHIAFMEHRDIQIIHSYDTDFDQVSGITRREP